MFGHVETAVNGAPRVSSGGCSVWSQPLPQGSGSCSQLTWAHRERVLPFAVAKARAEARHPVASSAAGRARLAKGMLEWSRLEAALLILQLEVSGPDLGNAEAGFLCAVACETSPADIVGGRAVRAATHASYKPVFLHRAHAKNLEMELCFVTILHLRFLVSSGACSQRALVSWESSE